MHKNHKRPKTPYNWERENNPSKFQYQGLNPCHGFSSDAWRLMQLQNTYIQNLILQNLLKTHDMKGHFIGITNQVEIHVLQSTMTV